MMSRELGLRRIGGIGELVVGGEDGEAAEVLVLLLEVDRALVELVVAERHRRQAELRHGAHLDFAVERG